MFIVIVELPLKLLCSYVVVIIKLQGEVLLNNEFKGYHTIMYNIIKLNSKGLRMYDEEIKITRLIVYLRFFHGFI